MKTQLTPIKIKEIDWDLAQPVTSESYRLR